MTKNFYRFILLYSCLLNNALALPWFEKQTRSELPDSSLSVAKKEVQDPLMNYSGHWAGQCDNSPAVELNIKHNKDKLSISYGFITENYIIGEVESTSKSHLSRSENSHKTLMWSPDHRALIFIHSDLFNNETGNLNGFFSKVSMILQNEELAVSGQYFYTNSNAGSVQQDTISCNYHRRVQGALQD